MLEQNIVPVGASTIAALSQVSEPDRASYNYCASCETNLLRVEKITLRVTEMLGECVIYGLCPKCAADLFKSNRKRNRVERRAEEKVHELMLLEGMEVGGTA